MSTLLSNYLGNAVLTQFFDATTYLSLHSSDPGLTGTGELGGGDYARQLIKWTTPSNKTIGNTNDIKFANLLPATILYYGVWDELVGGNFLIKYELVAQIDIDDGDTFVLPVNELAITL